MMCFLPKSVWERKRKIITIGYSLQTGITFGLGADIPVTLLNGGYLDKLL